MIKHIIFDLGNVLVDIHPERTAAALSEHCCFGQSQVNEFFLSKLHTDFMGGMISPRQFYEKFIRDYNCKISYTPFMEIWGKVIGEPKKGLKKIIEQLKRKFTLSLCSNTDPVHWEIAKNRCNFFGNFTHFFLSFEINSNKPDPVIFKSVLKALSAESGECLFIDDTEQNILTAGQLGFITILASDAAEIRKGLAALEFKL